VGIDTTPVYDLNKQLKLAWRARHGPWPGAPWSDSAADPSAGSRPIHLGLQLLGTLDWQPTPGSWPCHKPPRPVPLTRLHGSAAILLHTRPPAARPPICSPPADPPALHHPYAFSTVHGRALGSCCWMPAFLQSTPALGPERLLGWKGSTGAGAHAAAGAWRDPWMLFLMEHLQVGGWAAWWELVGSLRWAAGHGGWQAPWHRLPLVGGCLLVGWPYC